MDQVEYEKGEIPSSELSIPRSAFRDPHSRAFRAVVMGGSAGGVEGLTAIFAALPADFELPVLVVQHLHPSDDGAFARHLARGTRLTVVEPCDKERIERGRVYAAPANYHMLVDRNGTISLSVDEKVNWSRPSIDVLFESAAIAWGEAVVAVLLSGASADGAKGMRSVRQAGGLTVAQDPDDAGYPFMPQSAIDVQAADKVLKAEEIGRLLAEFGSRSAEHDERRNRNAERGRLTSRLPGQSSEF